MDRGHGIADIDVADPLVDTRVMNTLLQLTDQSRGLERALQMFQNQSSNYIELGAVLHVALCSSYMMQPPWRAKTSVTVATELDRFLAFAEHVRAARWTDWCGTAIADIVIICVGGSDLGPRMASQELVRPGIDVPGAVLIHYVSNTDACAVGSALSRLDSARTGFLVQSKTFSTQDILMLADSGGCWLPDAGYPPDLQFAAIGQAASAQGFAKRDFPGPKVFCHAAISGINAYGPWGGELRKIRGRQINSQTTGA